MALPLVSDTRTKTNLNTFLKTALLLVTSEDGGVVKIVRCCNSSLRIVLL